MFRSLLERIGPWFGFLLASWVGYVTYKGIILSLEMEPIFLAWRKRVRVCAQFRCQSVNCSPSDFVGYYSKDWPAVEGRVERLAGIRNGYVSMGVITYSYDV